MRLSNNPLLNCDARSTIEAAYHLAEYLCIQKSNDEGTHPGEWLQLEMLRQALLSLRDGVTITQKVD